MLRFLLTHPKLWLLPIIGITLLHIGINTLIQYVWVYPSQLLPIKGHVRDANAYTQLVENSRSETRVNELIFFLTNYDKQFHLSEPTGKYDFDKTYFKYQEKLNHAEEVTVWINKNQIEYYAPTIFQIDIDKQTLLSYNEVVEPKRYEAIIFLVSGILVILSPYAVKFILETNES